MRFFLYIQIPKTKKIGNGNLFLNRDNKLSTFITDKKEYFEIFRTIIELVGADGIMLSGMEKTGEITSNGIEKYRYQEWWLTKEEN